MAFDDTEVLVCGDNQLVIAGKALQASIMDWYHEYLQHPQEKCLEETPCSIFTVMG